MAQVKQITTKSAPKRYPALAVLHTLIIRSDVFEKMGSAPDYFFTGNEDVVTSWLVNVMGYQMYCVLQAVVYHKYALKLSPERIYNVDKNRQALLLSTLKPSTFVIRFPVFSATEILILGYCAVKGMAYIKVN